MVQTTALLPQPLTDSLYQGKGNEIRNGLTWRLSSSNPFTHHLSHLMGRPHFELDSATTSPSPIRYKSPNITARCQDYTVLAR